MSNFRKFISMSAVAVLAGTNLLTSLTYAAEAKAWASLQQADFERNPLQFLMPDSNVYLYAVTEPNNYYVEFHGNTGTGTMEKQTFTYDDPQELNPNAFTKTGYTYSGWNTDANGGGSGYADKQEVENLAETGTVDLYAQWNVNSYDITYDLNDRTGSSSGSITPQPTGHVNYGVSFNVSEPTRKGYDFSGWNISNMDAETNIIDSVKTHESSVNNSKGHSFESLRATSGTVAFVAQWSAALTPYTVKHCKEVLTPVGTYTICETENLSGYTDQDVTPAVTGYDGFTAPSTQTEKVKADESTEITYNYTRNSYELTVIAGTGVQTAKGTGTVNTAGATANEGGRDTKEFRFEEPIELSYVLKSGYTGAVWSGYSDTASSFTMPHENITKEVRATAITYTVTGNYHGGTGAAPDEDSYVHTYTVETSLTLPTSLSRDHSIFSGWTGEGITTPTKNVKVGPNEIGDKVYDAVWDCVAGYQENEARTECIPNTDTEYTVEHYQQQLDGSYTKVETETPHGTTDTTAVWTGKNYSGFNAGYLSGAAQTISGDPAHKTVVQVRYDRDSYNYTITAPAGGVEATAITSSGITAAHSNEDGKITYGDEVTLSATMTGGYEFDYWEVKDSSNNPVTVTNSGSINAAKFDMPASAVTITPHLKMTSYDIHYDYNEGALPDGTAANPVTYNVETNTFTLNIPERDNSTFVGWSGGVDGETPTTQASVTIAKGSVGDRTYEAIWSCNAGYHEDGDSCVANEYTINVNYDDSDKTNTGITVTYDKFETIPNPSKSGYIFSGWTITGMSGNVTHYIGSESDTTTATSATGVMGDEFKNLTTVSGGTVTFTAVWEADEVTYTVHHMIEGLDVDTYSQTGQAETHTGKSDSPVVFANLDITLTGFTYSGGNLSGGQIWPNEVKTQTTIDRHGNTHIYLYYDRNRHTVVTAHDDGVLSTSGDGTYDFEHAVTVSAQVKSGYHFVQWTGTPAPAPTSVSGS